jgi:hypothetical protein
MVRLNHTSFLFAALAAVALRAQAPGPAERAKQEAEVARSAVSTLFGFAHAAENNKLPSRAKAAYEQILELYDADNSAARQALGFRREKGAWLPAPAGKEPKLVDAATPQQRQRTDEAWTVASKRLAGLHRSLGLSLLAQDELERGRFHLARAVLFDPADAEAHRALGHRERDGFFGTEQEVAFLDRMAAIRSKAKQLGSADFAPKALEPEAMPVELQRTGLELCGARTANFTIWARDDAAAVAETAQWAERALAMLKFLVGDRHSTEVAIRARTTRWTGVLRTDQERDLFLQKNPQALGRLPLATVQTFGGHTFDLPAGRAHVAWHRAEIDHDFIVAEVTQRCLSSYGNDGLGEGLVHAMTWLLVGTTITSFGWLPNTDAGGFKLHWAPPGAWLAHLREQVGNHEDCPLVQVARERLFNFRADAHTKSWWFTVWLLARHPDDWLDLLYKLRTDDNKVLMPDEVSRAVERALGRPVDDVELEWRQWALGESPLARASGFGSSK